MKPPFRFHVNLRSSGKQLVVISQIIENLQTEDRLNLLTECLIQVHSILKLDDELFEEFVDAMLSFLETELALELESRVYQRIESSNQNHQLDANGSQAWRLD